VAVLRDVSPDVSWYRTTLRRNLIQLLSRRRRGEEVQEKKWKK
jgi:hypothetical protein